jgi:hypothetical protein
VKESALTRRSPHTHPCERCQQPVACGGDFERNDDGWPEVVCTAYHLPSGTMAHVVCEACRQESA